MKRLSAASLPLYLGIPAYLGIFVCIAILGLHAGLLPEAHWRGDDFICAAYARDFRLHYLWQARIDGWSPRPLSETLFYLYCRLAAATGRPFTVPFMALLWSLLAASTLITARREPTLTSRPLPNHPLPNRLPANRLLIGLATVCLFLLGHPIAEMFFWPAGAVAYVTTLAASSLALFLLIDGRCESPAGTLALSASLAACAASSESGAMAAVPLSLALAIRPQPRRLLIAAPSLLIAVFVFRTLASHRMVSPHHAGLLATLPLAPGILLRDIASFWPGKLCFVLGLRGCGPVARRGLPGFAAALLLGCCASIAAGLFQFGADCCERHDSLRQCWIILALAALAAASTRWPPGARAKRAGPALLTLACLIELLPRLPAMVHDYRMLPEIAAISRANWQAGQDRTSTAMLYRLPPAALIAGGVGIPAGHYKEPAANDWTAHGIMDFFSKQSITIKGVSQ